MDNEMIMNESLRIIFRQKYLHAILFSVFLYTLGTVRNATDPLMMVVLNGSLIICGGLMQRIISRKKLIPISMVLYTLFNFPEDLLPQFEWVVRTTISIQKMNPYALLCLMTMNFYSLFSILEWYEINRALFWED
ncbi:hypothetical protein LSTR_LSTR007691 [Laodelphax striatellus]|uniref:Uncharacterized protein n=1 Tax=Laodelphax striatellus TaxID=195883 RepID=A0A482WJD8_LAOST|nr:hypothetical protein LSTR_LSTR007691 [Laodelphax striatellus]